MIARRLLLSALAGTTVSFGALPVAAQSAAAGAGDGWNEPGVRALISRAQALRRSVATGGDFETYRAGARGYVYFFIDRPDTDEHVLVKADQVALDLYWRAPDQARQRIVGQRDEKVLPTNIRYHRDHLTVVQDDFGDFIRLGDGDEVAAVLHPVGPGSGAAYDFRLADSLTLAYGTADEEVRVYEIQVRPKQMDRPGFVGTVFLDRANAAIVRMNFSFTPASYVDPYLDYIRISLDNSLWMGRYWLPYRQEVELRRETPLLDFAAGSVIRSRFRIGAYDFDVPLPEEVFARASVTSVSPQQSIAFPFERGLFDEIEEEGLTVSATMEDVRSQVREVVEDEVLTGLAPIRLHLDGVSDFARYNRAEGIFVGGGLSLRPRADARIRLSAGYQVGRGKISAGITVRRDEAASRPLVEAHWDGLVDMGENPGATPLVNTISAASGSKDFLDPYFRRGAALTLGTGSRTTLSAGLRLERHASASDVVSDGPDTDFRPVRSVHEGWLRVGELAIASPAGGERRAALSLQLGALEDRRFARAVGETEWRLGSVEDRWSGRLSARGGVTGSGAPVQSMFLLGGRHTLLGQDYRAFFGNAYWLVRAEGTVPIRPPYVGLRAFGAAGATHLGSVDLPEDWDPVDSNGLRGSVGLGLSIGWDAAYFDVGHGVRGGGWEAVFGVSQRFQGWM